jgi:hypothetical protein
VADEASPFLLRAPAYSHRCDIFLSSGSDVFIERDRFERIVKELNDQFHAVFSETFPTIVNLHVVRWEQSAPHKTGGDPNAEFRKQAKRAHITVVLLHDDIRPGTKDELEAALNADDVQVAVIWMKPKHPRAQKTVALRKYLESKKDLIIWDSTGEPGSDDAWHSMVRVLTKAALTVLRDTVSVSQRMGVHYESP